LYFNNNSIFSIIAKGASGGLGSGGVSSSRGAIVSSVIELHKDEEIYVLVGQMGENACIKSMGIHDEGCTSKQLDLPKEAKTRFINNMRHDLLDGGAGGGGGASYVFLVRGFKNFLDSH
jgi:anaplastic lymphoma kinase